MKRTFEAIQNAISTAEDIKIECKRRRDQLFNKKMSIKDIVDIVKDHLHSEDPGNEDLTGENFKQLLDNSNPHEHTEILGNYEMGKRVGRIQFNGGPGVGTGFRVGSKYVMTAYHVMGVKLERLLNVVNELPDTEKEEIGWTKDKMPMTRSCNISNLFSSDHKSKDKIKELVNLVTGKYEIKFKFLKEGDVGRIVKFKPYIAFASPEYDVLVLELEEQESELKFLLVEDNDRDEKLHVFGHPSNKPLQHDPACTILKDEKELSELKKEGIFFFKKELKNMKEKEIENSYSPCVISEDQILFHSSSSTAHGASGAPLTIVSEGIPKVYGMLLCGHPGIFYNSFSGRLKRLDLLVESGISMKKVRSLLKSSLPDLEKDLFRDG